MVTSQSFRKRFPACMLIVENLEWEYLSAGAGPKTILFLHGMTGSYDIWWQQIEALQDDYRILSVTYPAANSLQQMENGILAILQKESVSRVNLVGTSLGGYFAQHLMTKIPDRIEKAVLANTFPPNDILKAKNGLIGSLIPFLPERVVMNVLRSNFKNSIYLSSGYDDKTLAFLNELSEGRMHKTQVAARYRCVVEKFKAPQNYSIPILIIESSNDPLVEPALREQLRGTYPGATVITMDRGHFPYIAIPDQYTQALRNFWEA